MAAEARARGRARTEPVLQMEAVECGAACLAMVLAYHGRRAPLEELREACGVSRDGSKASNILRAARSYGMEARGYSVGAEALQGMALPLIVFWEYNHFVVLEGFGRDKAYLDDPAWGRRTVGMDEFEAAYSGVALELAPGAGFVRGGKAPAAAASLFSRLKGLEPALGFALLAGLLMVLPGLALPALARAFVDEVLIAGSGSWLGPIALAMAGTALVRGGLAWLRGSALARLEARLRVSGSSRLMLRTLRLPLPFFSQRMAGEIASRTGLYDSVAALVSGRIASSVLDALLAVFYGAFMIAYDPALAAVSFGLAAANFAALRLLSSRLRTSSMKLRQEEGRLVGLATSGAQMMETIKASSLEDEFFRDYASRHARAAAARQAQDAPSRIVEALPALLSAINAAAILAIGGLKVMGGAMSVGMLAAFQSLAASFMEPFNSLVAAGAKLQESGSELKRLDDLELHASDPSYGTGKGGAAYSGGAKLEGLLELRGVSFGYNRLEPPLVRDLSLRIGPGERVALVGASGSGKSTVAKLVAGLYEPWAGEILLDGRPLRDIPKGVRASSLAMVDQDIFLFEGEVRDNLAMWDATLPNADLIAAARDARIHDDISARPGAYRAAVGEGGANFSGGQRQRLEIARALADKPSIVVLDEATSALDPETEALVDEGLRRRGCACLIVAHRLSTIRDCDEIIFLERGVAVERGSHGELMKAGGRYAELIATA